MVGVLGTGVGCAGNGGTVTQVLMVAKRVIEAHAWACAQERAHPHRSVEGRLKRGTQQGACAQGEALKVGGPRMY